MKLDRLCIVLVATRNPLNIGATARAMSNFGTSQLRVVRPYAPSFREARSAVGASEVLARAAEFASVAEAVADCTLVVGTTAASGRALQHPLKRLEEGAKLIRRCLSSGKVAILFGSEKRGLSNDDLSHCHWLMRIPTRETHGSMNLGQAAAVCIYAIAAQGNTGTKSKKTTPASAGVLERISSLLLETAQASGYLKSGASGASEEKLRRLVRRLRLDAADAEIWLGILRQIAWKLRSQNVS